MADLHLDFVGGTSHASRLRNILNHGESFLDGIGHEIATMQLMIDGDGTQIGHFVGVAASYGFENTGADAKAAWEELQSAYSKVSGDGSVSNVNAALKQLFNKLR